MNDGAITHDWIAVKSWIVTFPPAHPQRFARDAAHSALSNVILRGTASRPIFRELPTETARVHLMINIWDPIRRVVIR